MITDYVTIRNADGTTQVVLTNIKESISFSK